MILSEFTRLIKARLMEHSIKISDGLSSGTASDYAEYKFMCGRLRGHRDILEAIDEALLKLNEDVDE